jgi:uncharacterized protein (DUF433 family)
MNSDVINIDRDILSGTPVFNGTRVPISILFDYLEDDKMEEFLENPSVSKEQVTEVIKIAADIFSHKELLNENIAR